MKRIHKKAMGTKDIGIALTAINIILLAVVIIFAVNTGRPETKQQQEAIKFLESETSLGESAAEVKVYEETTKEYIVHGANVTIKDITVDKINEGDENIRFCVDFDGQDMYFNERFVSYVRIDATLFDTDYNVLQDETVFYGALVSDEHDKWTYCSEINSGQLRKGQYYLGIIIRDKLINERMGMELLIFEVDG